jgi:Domain of unknown function (DUF4331)
MSDHFSGPRALAGPAGDISDIYAFPSPERSDRLVLGMMTQPLAPLEALYSDAIVYRFRMRPLTIEPEARKLSYGPAESELVFSCAFDEPRPHNGDATPVQVGWLTTPSGELVRFQVNDERGGQGKGVRVFAGVRSDPFFIDLPAYLDSLARGQLAFKPKGQNNLEGANVLGLVVEVDRELLLERGGGPLFGVVGETVVAAKLPVRIERFGRVEIKNVIMSMKNYDQVNRDIEIRDLYNLEDAFHLGKDYRDAYRARLNANLAAIDRLDGKVDWPLGEDGSHPLTDLLLDDYLAVDVSKPYTQDSYFDIERAMLEGRPHATCGGRSMNDHTMDAIYTLLINAGNGPRISDGVDQATVRASDVFPYLAPPNAVVPDDLPIMGFVKSLGFQAATSGGAR